MTSSSSFKSLLTLVDNLSNCSIEEGDGNRVSTASNTQAPFPKPVAMQGTETMETFPDTRRHRFVKISKELKKKHEEEKERLAGEFSKMDELSCRRELMPELGKTSDGHPYPNQNEKYSYHNLTGYLEEGGRPAPSRLSSEQAIHEFINFKAAEKQTQDLLQSKSVRSYILQDKIEVVMPFSGGKVVKERSRAVVAPYVMKVINRSGCARYDLAKNFPASQEPNNPTCTRPNQ